MSFKHLQYQLHLNPPGNVLIYVVVLMLIFGVLGVVMVSLFTSATASTVTRNDNRRARYLSESGVRYASSELRIADFDENSIIDPLNTLTYTVSGAGSFDINIFSPWFDSNASVDSPADISLSVPLGELPDDFTAPNGAGVWVVNYDYITGTGPDITTMRDRIASYTKDDATNLTIGISSDFVVNQDERVCLAVEPIGPDQDITEGGDLNVARDARFFFPPFNGAININRVDYAYARLVDDEAGGRVILENVTASQFPNTLPTFPSPILSRGTGGSPYDGDFVILSPRNYMVMAEGTSDAVSWGDAYALGVNVYDHSVVRPGSEEDADISPDVFIPNRSEQESAPGFFTGNTVDYELDIGGGSTDEFGSTFFDATLNIGGERNYCVEGACLFTIGVRVYFLLNFNQQGDGITFTLINGANNRETSVGGDFELSELMGYAGDSRTSAGFLATAPEDRGLDPPKIAVEFDTRTNNDTLAYCNGANVNQNTRDDPLVNNQDAVQYVYWGREANVASPCRDNPTYDDNRHGPGFWQFDNPGGAVKSSPAVDPGNGTIYVGSNDNKLYAINPNGTQKWAFTTGGDVLSSPAVGSDGTIYVGSNDNRVYAIDPGGTEKWQFVTGGDVRSSPAIASDGTIYIGSNDGFMYALDPTTGAQKPGWPFNTGAPLSLGHPGIGPDGAIYFTALNTVYARYPDGSIKWTVVLGPSPGSDNDYMPGVDPNTGTVYTDVPGNAVAALNPANGSEIWRVGVRSDVDSTPIVGPDGTIYFGTDDDAFALFAVTSGGAVRWEFTTGDDVDTSPALSPDASVVYAVSNDGNVYAVDTATGEEKWSFAIVTSTADSPANVTSSPAVDPNTGIIYVGSDDTNVYALTPFDDEPRNEQGLLLDSAADVGGVADDNVNWLNGSSLKGPWAVRLEVDRGILGDYELRLWMKQCDNDACDTLNGANDPFFEDTRIIYQLSPPNLVQFFQLDAIKNAEFDRFLFGFTAAAGADPLDVTIANFALSFIRPGDPIIDVPEF
jgi:outer membrane protein assembly factor BamB